MRPTPIPNDEIWAGAIRRVIAPPGGDLTDPGIAPVEALIDRSPRDGTVCFHMRCVLEDGDLDKLTTGGRVWLTFYSGVPPFCLTVVDKDGHQ